MPEAESGHSTRSACANLASMSAEEGKSIGDSAAGDLIMGDSVDGMEELLVDPPPSLLK